MKKTQGGKREGSGRKRTQLNERRVQLLRERGMSYRAIAEAFQVPTHVISYYFNFILPKEK
jgi:transposase